MKNVMSYKTLLIVFALIVCVSCGSGGGGSPDLAGGGIGGTGISVGKITGFGSVFVNGVEFDTKDATIIVDGKAGDQSDLQIGMIVTVEAVYDAGGTSGAAKRIEFKDNLEGPVESINTTLQTLVVLGQTVKVDNETDIYDDDDIKTSLDNIGTGNIVEVSGFVDTKGDIHATYIKLKTPDTMEFELKGTISNLDTDARTFTLGNMKVNFGSAELKDIPGGLSNGLFVEVKSTSGIDNSGELFAGSVEAEQHTFSIVEGERVEIEGIVNRLVSVSEIEVNGQPVQITPQTRFEDGSGAPDIKPDIKIDVKLEVEGKIDSKGVLIAEEISLEMEDDREDESNGDISRHTDPELDANISGDADSELDTNISPESAQEVEAMEDDVAVPGIENTSIDTTEDNKGGSDGEVD